MDLRELRKRLGLSRQGMAILCGASFSAYEKWEYGTRKPSGAAKRCVEAISYMESQGMLRDFMDEVRIGTSLP